MACMIDFVVLLLKSFLALLSLKAISTLQLSALQDFEGHLTLVVSASRRQSKPVNLTKNT